MQQLEALVRQAQADASSPAGAGDSARGTALPLLASEAELARQLQICNACRYCEGFCAVFPAMTRRLEFGRADLHYLANLCHGCGACLHACQYAPPHEFAVSIPQAMATVRARTYADYAWPQPLGRLYERNGLTLALALAIGLALFLALAAARHGGAAGLFTAPAGSFYAIFPHGLMVSLFAPVFAFAVLALGIGVSRFWALAPPGAATGQALQEAAGNALTLKYLDGGHGQGCNETDDRWTQERRACHHATFYGFMLCFAATSVATVYHYLLGWPAPYALGLGWLGVPKLLGSAGGVLLVLGTAGLLRLRLARHPRHTVAAHKPMDLGFIALLLLTGASGLALALAQGSAALPLLLCLHLGAVMAFFATMPYGKFAHGIYRGAALLKWSIERRLPTRLRLGSE